VANRDFNVDFREVEFMPEQELPLSGVRVLDLSEGIAGPGCTKIMAHLGADVIKVERPRTGDVTRALPPFYKDRPHLEGSGLFLYLNMGKRGITLNLEMEQGRTLFKKLVTASQIVVESFSAGTMEAWGLGYAALEALTPSLVMASITPFGQAGPYRDLIDSDIVLQALGGLLYISGEQDREPLRQGGNPAYLHAAMQSFSGIMNALFYAESTGVGEYLDIAVVECIAVNAMYSSLNYDQAGRILSRSGDRQPVFQAADGYVGFVLRAENWHALCQVLGRPELEHDPRFADEASRQVNRPEMLREIAEAVRRKEKAALYRSAQEIRIPTGYVCTAADLLASPQYQERGFLRQIDHPLTGTLTYPGVPWKMDDLPLVMQRAPCLGEHNREVYQNLLGLAERELAGLQAQGII
jgi:CoA:oxalate CoA-transferase